jgi:hypothetical protein
LRSRSDRRGGYVLFNLGEQFRFQFRTPMVFWMEYPTNVAIACS